MSSDPNSKQFRKTGKQIKANAVNGYNIIQELGKGSTGSVFRAVQMSMNREVALKILHPRLSNHDGFIERFQREAQMAGAVHHPNVITCFDAGESQGYIFQALELLDGGDLRSLAQKENISEAQVIAIMLDCARGLAAIHDADLNHGDIDPSNIFLSVDGEAKLGDLGLARSMHGDRPVQNRHINNDASAFIAPECYDSNYQADIRSDIYSLGAVMYYLLTSQAPFIPNNEQETEWYGSTDQDLDPRNINPDISAGVAAIVRKAIAPQPLHRYNTPADFLEDLERVNYNFSPIHASRSETGAYKVPTNKASETVTTRRQSKTGQTRNRKRNNSAQAEKASFLNYYIMTAVACLCIVLFWLLYVEINKPETTSIPQTTITETEPETTTPQDTNPVVPSFKTPRWASAAGTDDYGHWAEFKIGTFTQRMRYIEAGQFTMGTIDSADNPSHQVSISQPYWIANTEMSQGMYQSLMGQNPSRFQGDILPVESVSWKDAQDCIEKLKAQILAPARLPTEAEWEYACSDAELQHRHQSIKQLTNSRTQPIASMAANKNGLYDCISNVKEWVADAHSTLSTQQQDDPQITRGLFRVARGSAWSMSLAESTTHTRSKYQPVKRFFFLGFRIAIADE